MSIPISTGSGQASVAAEAVAGLQYQQIEVLGSGGASILSIDTTGAAKVNVVSGSILAVNTGSVITVFQSSSIIAIAAGSVVSIPTGSVISVFQSSSLIARVTGSVVSIPSGNQSVSGNVGASIIGSVPVTTVTSIVSFVDGFSNLVGTPVAQDGLLSVVQQTYGYVFNGATWDRVRGNAANGQVVQTGNASILTIPTSSTITVFQAPSIVGTYAEDAAHTTADKGLFALAVRNDTLASVTSADVDYSPISVGPIGEVIQANAPITKWVSGTADFRQGNAGASIIVIATGGSSIFTYITGVQLANFGPSSVLVTLASGGSILGYSIAPAGGGSNISYPNGLKTPGNFGFAASINGIASVLVSAQGFISKV